jgi:hypothetical protein
VPVATGFTFFDIVEGALTARLVTGLDIVTGLGFAGPAVEDAIFFGIRVKSPDGSSARKRQRPIMTQSDARL